MTDTWRVGQIALRSGRTALSALICSRRFERKHPACSCVHSQSEHMPDLDDRILCACAQHRFFDATHRSFATRVSSRVNLCRATVRNDWEECKCEGSVNSSMPAEATYRVPRLDDGFLLYRISKETHQGVDWLRPQQVRHLVRVSFDKRRDDPHDC